MKREEHYCDACGEQMTKQTSDNETELEGIIIRGITSSYLVPQTTCADTEVLNPCGSTSSRHTLHGQEFCSYYCFAQQRKSGWSLLKRR